MTRPLVRMTGIVKRFDDVVANDRVSLDVLPGEVHALLGENGAGKTTLMNVLYGLTRPDEGTIAIDGRSIAPRSPAEAIAAGVGMVHQHPLLVGPLTVAENMRLGGVGNGTPAGMARAIAEVARTFPVEVDARARVDALPMSVRQRLEIVRCLVRGVRVLVLDEPTAVLTPPEVRGLFDEVRRLTAGGHAVVFITHKLAEVATIADRVTVLRSGRLVGTLRAGEAGQAELARMMVGRSLALGGPDPATAPAGPDVRLELRACSVRSAHAPGELDEVSLEVAGGEIVCLAGVEGNGQRALSQVLFGLRRPSGGAALVDGRPVPEAGHWRRAGVRVGRIPEDRRHQGLVLEAPLWRNLLMGPMAPYRAAVPRKREVLAWARRVLGEYGVSPPEPRLPAGALSGGNQQKVVLARELAAGPRAIVAVNPTRGLDVGATGEVYERLRRLRHEGIASLVISTDLDEVLRLADRVGVLYRGRLTGPFRRDEIDRERVGLLMAGVRVEDGAA